MIMSMIVWNIRGLGRRASKDYLKLIKQQFRPVLLAILEPMQQAQIISSFASSLCYGFFLSGYPTNNAIWFFWNSDVQVHLVSIAIQSITMILRISYGPDIKLSIIYAKCTRLERQTRWTELRDASSTTMPWLLGGDFNTILSSSKKKGSVPADPRSMLDFLNFLIEVGLTDLGFEGSQFTWSNHQSGRR